MEEKDMLEQFVTLNHLKKLSLSGTMEQLLIIDVLVHTIYVFWTVHRLE